MRIELFLAMVFFWILMILNERRKMNKEHSEL
jgi:preprotein translocase subunit YajC